MVEGLERVTERRGVGVAGNVRQQGLQSAVGADERRELAREAQLQKQARATREHARHTVRGARLANGQG